MTSDSHRDEESSRVRDLFPWVPRTSVDVLPDQTLSDRFPWDLDHRPTSPESTHTGRGGYRDPGRGRG